MNTASKTSLLKLFNGLLIFLDSLKGEVVNPRAAGKLKAVCSIIRSIQCDLKNTETDGIVSQFYLTEQLARLNDDLCVFGQLLLDIGINGQKSLLICQAAYLLTDIIEEIESVISEKFEETY